MAVKIRAFRLTDDDLAVIDQIAQAIATRERCDPPDRTDVIRRAIRRLAAELKPRKKDKKPSKTY